MTIVKCNSAICCLKSPEGTCTAEEIELEKHSGGPVCQTIEWEPDE